MSAAAVFGKMFSQVHVVALTAPLMAAISMQGTVAVAVLVVPSSQTPFN